MYCQHTNRMLCYDNRPPLEKASGNYHDGGRRDRDLPFYRDFFERLEHSDTRVRHAERNDLENCSQATVKGRPNPTLALTGGVSTRAQALAHVGGEDGIAAIYASEFCRSQQTVQPLATQLGLTVNVVDQFEADGTTVNVDGLIEQIWANNKGQVVLVVGHNNTVPVIIEELSGISIEAINETDFDNLYMVVVPRWWGRAKVVRLKYGAPT